MAGLGEYEEIEGGEGRKHCYKLSFRQKPTTRPKFDLQTLKIVTELTLAPSGDEILLVRSQELQTNAFMQNQG